MARLLEIFLCPPLAIARLGGSDNPLEAFDWMQDTAPHSAARTTITPTVSLEVRPDGTLQPYVPSVIRFKDGGQLRPVAPFFEMWARVERPGQSGAGATDGEPVTLSLLRELGLTLGSLHYTITVANRKAERRTGDEACAFVARLEVGGDDFRRLPLLASSPHLPGQQPLVFPERPIPLGSFQVTQPILRRAFGIDLSVVRVRFTPARGQVYGPPETQVGAASVVPPGYPTTRLDRNRLHEIVRAENRILNPDTPWSTYYWDAPGQTDPQPSDSYDGAHEGELVSWSVVDDTCDGVIEAYVVSAGERFVASARVLSGCPDYAPDRRHFVSFADDLADRDLPTEGVDPATQQAAEAAVADLFARVLETIGQLNLDGIRQFAILDNEGAPPHHDPPELPQTDKRTMTEDDTPYAEQIPDLLDSSRVALASVGVANDELPYTLAVRAVHSELSDPDALLLLLRTRADRIRQLVRPPFGRFHEFETDPGPVPGPAHRDPRVVRDTLADMRMPPYMRDSDENPLSLTWRQYRQLMDLVDFLAKHDGRSEPVAGPARRRVQRTARRLESQPRQESGQDA